MTQASASASTSWIQHLTKGVALVASTGAAVVSIVTALYSYGVVGKSESHNSIGNLGAAWVRLRPAVDTASAIGDTIHFAATIADKKGSILVGAMPTWATGDSSVATVGSDGAVIARGPGATTVSVVVGSIVSTARIVVRQQVAAVSIASPAADTAAQLLEGAQLQLRARAVDARGYVVAGRGESWHSDDTTIASLDARGLVTAQNAGRSLVSVKVDGVSASLPVTVAATAADIAVVAGADQVAQAGHPLPQRVVVRATNRRGAPAAGKLVTFRVRGPQGTIDPITATTDADGRARTQWTLGDDPGAQVLLASVENVDSAAVVTAEAEPVARNTRVVALAEGLRARAGTTIADSVGVRVMDSTGRALHGVPVRFVAAHGAAEAIDARTDSAGIARARWTLAARSGTQQLRAFVGTAESRVPPAVIAATALAGAPAKIVAMSGDGQRAAAGKALAQPIVLRVVDAGGNGAADVRVAIAVSDGAARDTLLVTDSAGVVRTRWTMGRSAGDVTLAARVDGVAAPLKVAAHANAAAAANLSFDDVPPATKATSPRTKRLSALVTDVYGNPVADAPVSFAAKPGAVTPARAVTDAHGRVALSWTMGSAAGDQRLTGTVRGSDVSGAYVAQLAIAAEKLPKGKKGAK